MGAERPRVAVLADWWWPEAVGGAERSARAAAKSVARFADVAVFVPGREATTYADGPLTVHVVVRPFARRRHADTAARRSVEFLSAWLLPAVAARLAGEVRRFRPDAVVAHNVSRTGPWLLRAVKKHGLPFVRSYHDLSDTCWRRSRLRGARNCTAICGDCRIKTAVMRRATPDSALSVCVSRFMQAELVRAGLTTPQRSMVAYPLVASDAGTPVPRAATGGGPVFGYIGRLDPVKGIDAAIRTVAAYRRRLGTPVSLLVAGEGQPAYVERLRSLAADEVLDVTFAGYLDVDEFCRRVDAVLIPSRWMEPFGRVAVEVGVCGRPMLISSVGGLPEAAAISGSRFAVADFERPDAAADVLAGLLDPAPGTSPGTSDPLDLIPLEQGIPLAVRHALEGAPGHRAGTTWPLDQR